MHRHSPAGGYKLTALLLLQSEAQEARHLLHEAFPLMPHLFKLLHFVFWHNEPVTIDTLIRCVECEDPNIPLMSDVMMQEHYTAMPGCSHSGPQAKTCKY